MLELLWLIPVLPLAGFLALAMGGAHLSRRGVAWVGVGAVGLAALVAILVAFGFFNAPPSGHVYTQTLWTWMAVANFTPAIAFYLDALSLVMVLVVTVIGFLIHLYAAEFMREEEGYSRFFAYMNLFVAAMLILLLADNLLLLYLGWEGVGLCSYLLIGFWYADPANGRAARKAFIVTRMGDTAMALGLFLLFTSSGTLEIQPLMQHAVEAWPVGTGLATAAAALLLGGAVGKSAQLPLQTWLPDAMAGPTPVSALIHAATMVTAGVYLIARLHMLFELAPVVQSLVAIIGAVTLLMAGCSALVQRDIKRVLAYSTMSQIGYMFLALGVGAWSAAIFHFMTHAIFKALLFLAAGAVILSLHHEHDIFRMGGLWRRLPVAFITFLIGSAALAGFPLITAGFYSKDLILWQTWAGPRGSVWLWAAGIVGSLLTALYIFRVVFRVFFRDVVTPVTAKPGVRIRLTMLVLALLAIVGGWIGMPETVIERLPAWAQPLRHLAVFLDVMHTALPSHQIPHEGNTEWVLLVIASAVSLVGMVLALGFLRRPRQQTEPAPASWRYATYRLWLEGWGFDRLYDAIAVKPYVWLARINRNDVFDAVAKGPAWTATAGYRLLRYTQTGLVRRYAMGIAIGAVLTVAITVFL